jgi:hypothetical protein
VLPTIPAKDETPPWQLRWFPKSITNLSAGLLETHPRHPPKWVPQRCGSRNVRKPIGSTIPHLPTFRLFDWNHPYGWQAPWHLTCKNPFNDLHLWAPVRTRQDPKAVHDVIASDLRLPQAAQLVEDRVSVILLVSAGTGEPAGINSNMGSIFMWPGNKRLLRIGNIYIYCIYILYIYMIWSTKTGYKLWRARENAEEICIFDSQHGSAWQLKSKAPLK